MDHCLPTPEQNKTQKGQKIHTHSKEAQKIPEEAGASLQTQKNTRTQKGQKTLPQTEEAQTEQKEAEQTSKKNKIKNIRYDA